VLPSLSLLPWHYNVPLFLDHHQQLTVQLIISFWAAYRLTATGAYMRHRFSWASLELNNFSDFCPFATFVSSKCS
jgi:hypothetical protein